MADFQFDPTTQVIVGDAGLRTWKGLAKDVSTGDTFTSPFSRLICCFGQWAEDSAVDVSIEWAVSGGVATLTATGQTGDKDFFFEICGF